MTTETAQLAKQFAKINSHFSSFWQTRKENGVFDEKHLVNSQGFRTQCLLLIQETLSALGTPSEAFKTIAQHNAALPGAAEGFAAAYGMCCGWKAEGHFKTYWAGIMDIAVNLGVSLVTQYFRRGFWAVTNYSELYLREIKWSDASLGGLLLHGPKRLDSYDRYILCENVPGIYRYFELLKSDPGCKQEWDQVEQHFQTLVTDDVLPMASPAAREVRHLVLGDRIVRGSDCSYITAVLIGYLTDESFTLQDVEENMAVLEHHDSYLRDGFSADFAIAVAKLEKEGDEDVPTDENGSKSITPLFKAKFRLFYETLRTKHAAADIVLATWVFQKRTGECLDIRQHYEGDPLWLQKQLMRQIEVEVGVKRVNSKVGHAIEQREWVFLEPLLAPLGPDEVMAVCGHSDLARELGFRVNGDTRLLALVQDEKVLSSALEYSLGM